MYVKRLIEFAEQHRDQFPPVGFTLKKVKWIVDIDDVGLTFNEVKNQTFIVPIATRSSNVKASLIVDKPDYVFNMGDKEDRHHAYKELLQTYITATADEDAASLLHLLQQPIKLPTKMKIGDFIVFRIRNEVFLHDNPNVQSFWQADQQLTEASSAQGTCMFCGEKGPLLERHSITFSVNRERTKMISANENAYRSHGTKASLVAPTCPHCEQKYGQALEYMLKNEPKKSYGEHMFSIGGMTYVYWLRSAQPFQPFAFFSATNEPLKNHKEMQAQLKQVFTGMKQSYDFNDFCLLVLSANKGRLVVRDYMECTLGQIHERIMRFLQAQDVGRDKLYGVYTLAGAIHQKPSTQLQKIDVRDWMNWALCGRPLSGRILIALVKRIQAEGKMYAMHAAVLKSWLVSQRDGREWTVTKDKTNVTTPYTLGRIFAIIEKIHGDAIGASDTLSSRFFGSASTTPKAIFGNLLRNTQHHLAKLGRDRKGLAVVMDKKLLEALSLISDFPSTLTLTEQAEFALGYYHEKEDLWKKKEEK